MIADCLSLAQRRRRCLALAVVAGALVAAGPAEAAPFVYVANGVNEFNPGTSVFQYDAPLSSFGALQALTPPTVTTGSGPRAVAVSPDGKSAYVTNWNAGTVSQYDVNPATGVLSAKAPAAVAAGSTPFGVAVSPDGRSAYVTHEVGFTVSQYDINPTTGALSAKTPATVAAGPSRGVAVSPDGKSAYVTDWDITAVFQYNVDPTTGALSPKTPATVASDLGPH